MSRNQLSIAALAIAVCAAFGSLSARSTQVAAQSIAAVTERFDAQAFEARRTAVKLRLRQALNAFENSLATQSERAQDEWSAYLKWDDWAGPALLSESWDQQAMQRVAKRLYAAEQGFEHPLVVQLRAALTDYLTFEEAVKEAGGDVEGEFRRRTDCLQRALRQGAEDYPELEDAAWWLAAVGQAPQMLHGLRMRFSGPVIVGQVHRDMVEDKLRAFENSSQEVRSTQRRIQGARVTGTSNVASHSTAELANGPEGARVRVYAKGSVDSPHNVARTGQVRVASSSRSQFTAVADVYWDGARFATTHPLASARTHSSIKSIDAPRLGRRIAKRRVYDSRDSAEAEVASLIEEEAAASMAEKLAAGVDKLNRKSQGLLNLMARTGNAARQWKTRVGPNAVEIGYLPTTLSGLGAPPHATPPLTGLEGIGLSFHDAAVEAILRSQVAGAEWTDVQFATLQRELTGGNNEELLVGLDPGRWRVQWSWRLPVRIQFSPDRATVHYRFARVEIDGAAHSAPFEVRAHLTPTATPLGLKLVCQDQVAVVSRDPARPLAADVQQFLERKFGGLFGEHFYLDGFQFPAGGHLDPLSGFRIVSANLESGWIHLRYSNRQPHRELVAGDSWAETRDLSRP